jgi:hypothetical protein
MARWLTQNQGFADRRAINKPAMILPIAPDPDDDWSRIAPREGKQSLARPL